MRSFQMTLLVSLALASGSAAAQVQTSGSGARGSINQSLSFGGSAALLNSFDLDFGFGNDHHITQARIMPDEGAGSVSIAYHDKNGDDSFRWQAGFFGVGGATTNAVTGSCRGRCQTSVPVPNGYLFVLRGFEVRYSSADHMLRTIGVEHGGGQLNVYFADKNSDDLFTYRVRYALVPTSAFTTWNNASGNGVGSATSIIPAGKTVIRGFMFSYASTDHNISRIAIKPQGTQLRLNYNDKNADDSFSWRVQWANLR